MLKDGEVTLCAICHSRREVSVHAYNRKLYGHVECIQYAHQCPMAAWVECIHNITVPVRLPRVHTAQILMEYG